MKILVLNSGSSSFKYKVYEVENNKYTTLAKGVAERIGINGSFIKYQPSNGEKTTFEIDLPTHVEAIQKVMEILQDKEIGVISDLSEITGVGHRIVHGGEIFSKSALITDEVIEAIKRNIPLAPLHNPANLLGIEAITKVIPNAKQVAVFDTAFHQTMPKKAYMYALPKELYTENKVRRYGFHGTSHFYVANEVAKEMGKDIKDLKIITCHIGNGASLSAVMNGKSVDTSMGFTPLAGVMMGTRSGDMDPYIPLFIMKNKGLSLEEVNNMMNKSGGVQAIAGHSDMRDVEDGYIAGTKADVEAFEMYIYRIQKYIGSYSAVMNGVDAIVFTAGVGENSPITRKLVMDNFEYLGVEMDDKANETRGTKLISTKDSKVKVFAIPTDEELVIAQDTVSLI